MEQVGSGKVAGLLFKGVVVLGLAMTVAACSSQRFGSRGTYPPPQGYRSPEPVEAIPSGPVTSEPLAPLPGTAPTDAAGQDFGTGQPVAGLSPVAPPPVAPAPASRMGVVGGWTARDATGASCRVVLSSTPTLDLYRASSSGCTNKELSKVSAWDFRNGEVYLYQSGGTMAARLRAQGSSMDGALTKSGAPLSMSR